MAIKMIHGDCMDLMRAAPDKCYDLACVDPPYGIGEALVTGGTWSVKWQKKGADWDVLPGKEYFSELRRVAKNWIIWGGNYFIEHLPNCRNFVAWHKPYMDGMHTMSNVELALTSFDENAKMVSLNKDDNERIHITQKPVALYKWLLTRYAKPGQTILDTHGGSGSIAIACHDLGFDLTWIEKDEDYYKAAVQRYQTHADQGSLFEPEPVKIFEQQELFS